MAYTPDPTDITNPFDTVDASTAAAEFRALKGYISTLVGGGGFPGVNVFRKNAIIGGDFDTNPWQRGISFAGVANNSYIADRFKYIKNGTMIENAGKLADAPTFGISYKNRTMDVFAINCLQTTVTTAETPIAVADFNAIQHIIEGYNFKLLAQLPLVISFWHRHTKVGTYCVALQNSGQNQSYIAEYSQAASFVWEFESIAIPASPAAGAWNYTTGAGLSISFSKAIGTNFQTPANIWTVGNFLASANQVNSIDTIGNFFQIALVQLEVGSIPSKFEYRTLQEELLLCQRYYEKSFFPAQAPAQNIGTGTGEHTFPATRAGAAVEFSNTYPFKVNKRITNPTIVTYNPSAANAQVTDLIAGGCTATVVTASDRHFYIQCTGNAGTVVGNALVLHVTADAEL